MKLKNYFENTRGTGVMSTADKDGRVDSAIYSRPHVMEDGLLAFIMRDRLTHSNLQSNPHAAYLFVEQGQGYQGKRLILTKVREETDTELLKSLQRRKFPNDLEKEQESRFLVFFQIDQELPLIGAGK
ncbi:MAG: pyridoxamine 5'-phosphate oxidase family protein [Desulfatirhabdiaceae bacterium]